MTALMDLKSAAAVLGISPCTLRRAVSAGKVPHRRIGGVIRFTEEDIRQYVEACAVSAKKTPSLKVCAGAGEIEPLEYFLLNR